MFIYSGATGNQLKRKDGNSSGDQFGYSVAGIGDADLDGIPDYVVGAPFGGFLFINSGYVKVFSGANHSLMNTLYGDAGGDQFGASICRETNFASGSASTAIFAVGAPHNGQGGPDSGLVRHILTNPWVYSDTLGGSAHQLFGSSLANVGINANGSDDQLLLIGSPGDDANGTNAGSASILSLHTLTFLHKFLGGNPGDQFGASVAYGGEYGNGGPNPFIVIGAPFRNVGSLERRHALRVRSEQLQFSLEGRGGPRRRRVGKLRRPVGSLPLDLRAAAVQLVRRGGAPGVAKLYMYSALANGSHQSNVQPSNLSGARFGTAVARGGDIDNDGNPDVIVGTPHADGSLKDVGRADVISPAANALIRTFFGDESGDLFGSAVGGNVDIDNDGRPDVIVGAPHHSSGANSGAGAVFVYSGKTGALIRSHFGSGANYQFGTSVCGAGDLDGDGYGDYVVGVPNADPNGTDSGRVRVFSGQTGNLLHTWDGDAAGDHFGTAVARISDIDGDGADEIAVGAPDHVFTGQFGSTGFVRVFSGKTGAVLFTLHGSSTSRLGLSVASARDVDGDGVTDVIAGALNQGTGIQLIDRGAVVVFSGATGNAIHVIGGGAAYQHFGASVAGLGDINKNGFGDFAVGALANSQLFLGAGFVSFFDGSSTTALYTLSGENLGDQSGSAIAAIGDVTGDGALELLIGAPGITNDSVPGMGLASIYDFSPSASRPTAPEPRLQRHRDHVRQHLAGDRQYQLSDHDDELGSQLARARPHLQREARAPVRRLRPRIPPRRGPPHLRRDLPARHPHRCARARLGVGSDSQQCGLRRKAIFRPGDLLLGKRPLLPGPINLSSSYGLKIVIP